MFCTKCGSKLKDDVLFCTSCGNKVKRPEVVAPAVQTPEPEAPAFAPQPQVIEAPAFEPAPQVAEAPAFEPAPQVIEAPAFEPAPQVAEAPAFEPAPQVAEAPAFEPAPQVIEAPAFEPAPQVAEAPAFEPAPQVIEAPAYEPAPQVAEAPAFEPAPQVTEVPAFEPQTSVNPAYAAPVNIEPAPGFNEAYQNNSYNTYDNNAYDNNAYDNNTYAGNENYGGGYDTSTPFAASVSNGVNFMVEAVQNAGSNICVLLAAIFGYLVFAVPIGQGIYNSIKWHYFLPSVITSALGGIFMLLISIGLTLIFTSSKKRNCKAGGYTMIKVVLVIDVVFLGIVAGIILIAILAGIIFAIVAYNDMPDILQETLFEVIDELNLGSDVAIVIIVLVVVLLLVATVFVLAFMWYGKMIKTMNLAKSVLAGRPVSGANASLYVIVMKFIGLAFALIGLIISLVAMIIGGSLMGGYGMSIVPFSNYLSMFGLNSSLLVSVCSFLFGLFYVISLIKARTLINNAKRMG